MFNKITLDFLMPKDDHVLIEIYDMSGKLVQVPFNSAVSENIEYKAEFDGTNIPSGLYIYKMITNNRVISGKLVLMK